MRNTLFIALSMSLLFTVGCSSTITAPPVNSPLTPTKTPATQESPFSSFPQPVPALSSQQRPVQQRPLAQPGQPVLENAVVADVPVVVNPNAPSTQVPAQIPFGVLPDNFSIDAPYAPPGAFEGTYQLTEKFLVDQDTFNSWQAANITSNGEHLFIAAVDDSPSKGTIIQMSLTGEDKIRAVLFSLNSPLVPQGTL